MVGSGEGINMSVNTLQLKRGIKATMPVSANIGEPLYSTDTKELFIGNGVGNPITRIGGPDSTSKVDNTIIKDINYPLELVRQHTIKGSGSILTNYPVKINVYRTDPIKWQSSQSISNGDIVVALNDTGYSYECTSVGTGTTGLVEPIWPTQDNSTIVDGSITWTCRGNNVFIGPKCRTDFKDIHFKSSGNNDLSQFMESGSLMEMKLEISPPDPKYLYAIATGIGKISPYIPGNQLVIAWGTRLDSGYTTTAMGIIVAYDSDGNELWRYLSPNTCYPMGLVLGDLDDTGTGIQDVIVNYKVPDACVSILDGATGTLKKTWPFIVYTYHRGMAVGKFLDIPGKQLAIGGNTGNIYIIDKNMNTIYAGNLSSGSNDGVVQAMATINILDNEFDQITAAYGNHTVGKVVGLRCDRGSIETIWTWNAPSPGVNIINIAAPTGVIRREINKQGIVFGVESNTEGTGTVVLLDRNGSIQWSTIVTLYKDVSSPGGVNAYDVNLDGEKEIVIHTGGYGMPWPGQFWEPIEGHGAITTLDLSGNIIERRLVAGPGTGSAHAVGDLDSDGNEEWALATNVSRVLVCGNKKSNHATFWINIPTIPVSPAVTNISMYYGNFNIIAASNINTVFPIFSEEFDTNTAWTPNVNSSNIKIGEIAYNSKNGGILNQFGLVGDITNLTDISTYRSLSYVSPFILSVFYSHDSIDAQGKNTISLINTGGTKTVSIGVDTSMSTTYYIVNGSIISNIPRKNADWAKIEFKIESNGITGYIDGVQVFYTTAMTLSDVNNVTLYGRSWNTGGAMAGAVDTMYARPYVLPEPNHLIWQTEQLAISISQIDGGTF